MGSTHPVTKSVKDFLSLQMDKEFEYILIDSLNSDLILINPLQSILHISGMVTIPYSNQELNNLKLFIERGGTLLLHAHSCGMIESNKILQNILQENNDDNYCKIIDTKYALNQEMKINRNAWIFENNQYYANQIKSFQNKYHSICYVPPTHHKWVVAYDGNDMSDATLVVFPFNQGKVMIYTNLHCLNDLSLDSDNLKILKVILEKY
ncbi:hypothetical protein ABK040_000691 [Willaertia magna]